MEITPEALEKLRGELTPENVGEWFRACQVRFHIQQHPPDPESGEVEIRGKLWVDTPQGRMTVRLWQSLLEENGAKLTVKSPQKASAES